MGLRYPETKEVVVWIYLFKKNISCKYMEKSSFNVDDVLDCVCVELEVTYRQENYCMCYVSSTKHKCDSF